MKAVILAGGLGTRISEETSTKPKPMVDIGGKPILWHIMKIYSTHGINDFIICCGYKGYTIKEYFANYFLHQSDVTFMMKENKMKVHQERAEPWTVTLIDTGEHTMTGGRLARVSEYIKDEELFCFTYGDGLSNVNITESIKFHREHGKEATLTSVYRPARFGAINVQNNQITEFTEKPKEEGGLINGGFFVLSPKVLKRVSGDDCIWEQEPLISLAKENNLMAFKHEGFWQPMDTLRDMVYLQELWQYDKAPWKIW
ncbi:glucose-1-phosphate cytidylyltransferase [Alphaproteobacteria bacterium]|nr:glucose-1-phosphate cytidylyltransferase [Alphaproteobacteria bacterium]